MRRALLAALLLAGLVAPPAASAEDLYVSPSSARVAGSCPVIAPCTLPAGIAAADQPGDVVRVMDGSYMLTAPAEIAHGVAVVGSSATRPVVHGHLRTKAAAAQTRLEHLEVVGGLDLGQDASGTGLVVRSSTVGVDLSGGALHQSLVVVTGGSAIGVRADRGDAQLTSSTVLADGPGARAVVAHVASYQGECFYLPPDLVLTVRNVIARGTAGDLVAQGTADDGCADPARMEVSYSNFRTAHVASQTASISQGAGNQTDPALTDDTTIFADAMYRQQDGAPTRDAGAPAAPAAPADLDGQARVQEGRTDIGADELPAPPRALTRGTAELSEHGATLQGLVTPNGSETRVVFDYGLTDAYGSSTTPQTLAAGGAETSVQARVEGLAAGTTFHFRVRASNPEDAVQPQTTAGSDATFSTLAPPVVPPPAPVVAPPPPVVTPPPGPPPVVTALTAKRSLKLATFRRKGLRIGFTLGRAGTVYDVKVTARLRVRGKVRTVVLARARGTAGAGVRKFRVKPSRRTVALLRRRGELRAKLVVTATPAGGAARTATRPVTMTR